jgi:hypothetical protein
MANLGRARSGRALRQTVPFVPVPGDPETQRPHGWKRRGGGVCAVLAGLAFLTSGCAGLFPRADSTTKSPWTTYQEAQAAFDRIIPHQTAVSELKALGFDPESPNAKSLTYLDVIQRFMPNHSMTKGDLDPAVRKCVEALDQCRASELELIETRSRRFGGLFLDVTGFKRQTRETGWQFKALVLFRDSVVVYKLAAGQPLIDRSSERVRPLGPLQELEWIFRWGFDSM